MSKIFYVDFNDKFLLGTVEENFATVVYVNENRNKHLVGKRVNIIDHNFNCLLNDTVVNGYLAVADDGKTYSFEKSQLEIA